MRPCGKYLYILLLFLFNFQNQNFLLATIKSISLSFKYLSVISQVNVLHEWVKSTYWLNLSIYLSTMTVLSSMSCAIHTNFRVLWKDIIMTNMRVSGKPTSRYKGLSYGYWAIFTRIKLLRQHVLYQVWRQGWAIMAVNKRMMVRISGFISEVAKLAYKEQ